MQYFCHHVDQYRVEEQRTKLGPEKLTELAKKVEEAKEVNDRPIPDGVLTGFPIPSLNSISQFPILSTHGDSSKGPDDSLSRHVHRNGHKVPYFVQLDHVKSAFTEINFYIDTTKLDPELRPFLELYSV